MKKIFSLVSAILLLSITLCIIGVSSEAAGSLTIKYTRKDTGRGIAGVELSVFKVGDPAGGSYALTDDFQGANVDLNALTTAQANSQAAEVLLRYAERYKISGITAETGSDGNAYFGGLSLGVYLVAQTKDFDGYYTISPYLVTIPAQSVNGAAIYNVLSNVKTERKSNGGGGGSSGGGDNTFSASVTKIWDDADDADGIRPQNVSVTLLKDGTKQATAVLNAQNGWRHTFTGLSGSLTSYTVEEDTIDGYTPSYSRSTAGGFVIINRHDASNPPSSADTVSLSVKKQWNDNNNAQGIRPDSVSVQLIKDGIVFRTAQLDTSNGWSFTFDKLSKGEYTIKEITTDGYGVSYSRTNGNLYTITNTIGDTSDNSPLTPADPTLTSISVKKVWDDNGNADGSRPSAITVDLIKDGEKYASAELSEESGWQHSFTDLPKNSLYSVYENETIGTKYSVDYSGNAAEGYVITNTYPTDNPTNDEPEPTSPSTVDIPVEKHWRDGDNEGGIRPESITVNLIKDGSIFRKLELSEDNGWCGVFYDVPSDGAYSIIEEAVTDYVAAYAQNGDLGFTITNTAVPGTTDIGIPPKPFIPAQKLGGGEATTSSSAPAAIPQTGNMNWPIPILAVSGLIFIIIGLVLIPNKSGEEA